MKKQDTTPETGAEPVQPEADEHDQKQPVVAKDTNTKTITTPAAEKTRTKRAVTQAQSDFVLADWEYTVDEAAKTINLSKYVGTGTAVTIDGRITDGQYVGYAVALNQVTNTFWGDQVGKITDIAFKAASDGTKVKFTGDHLLFGKYTDNGGFRNLLESLQTLDLSGLDTSAITNMKEAFYYLNKVTKLDLTGLDTHNVTNMDNMFGFMESVLTLDLSSFDTSNVTWMDYMFRYCNIRELDLSHFDTSKVVRMSGMFKGAINLKALDISNFDMTQVTRMSDFWTNTPFLRLVNMANLTMDKMSDVAKTGLKDTLNKRSYNSAVAIVARPDVFAWVKSDDSGTVIGPKLHAGEGKFADGSSDKNLVKSQNINPDDVYAALPTADELNFETPTRDNYNFANWGNDGEDNDLQFLHLDRDGKYTQNFATADYTANYSQTDVQKYGADLHPDEVTTNLNTVPDANKAFDAENKAEKHIKEIAWKDADSIDTSLEATTKDPVAYKAVVTFNDGTTVEIDVPVKVMDNRTDAEKNNPDVTTSVTVTQGEDVNPEDLVKNREQLPDVTIDWIVAPNTDQVGTNTGIMTINYPDGSQQGITITITVLPKEEQVIPDKDGATETTDKEVVDANESTTKVTPTAVAKKVPAITKERTQTTPTRSLPQTGDGAQPMQV